MSWIFVALIAPILWSVVNHLDKLLVSRYGEKQENVGGLMIWSAVFGLIVLVTLALIAAVSKTISLVLDTKSAAVLIGSGVLYAIFVYLYLHALFHDEASVVMPITQTVPIFGFVFAFFLLGETLTLTQVVGSLMVMVASVTLVVEIKEFGRFHFRWRTFMYAVGASAVYALAETVFKTEALGANFVTSLFWSQIGIFIFGALIALSRNNRSSFLGILKNNVGAVLVLNTVGESLTLLSDIATRYALLLAPVTLVFMVAGIQPVFVLILGTVLSIFLPKYFREKVSRGHLLHKSLCIVGIVVGTIIALV